MDSHDPPGSVSNTQRMNAAHEIMEGDEYYLISSSEGAIAMSHHVDPKNYARYIGYLEVAKAELVEAIARAAHNDG